MSAAAPGGDFKRSAITTLIRSIPVAVMTTDRDIRVLAASPRWMRDLGLTEADFAERSIYELAPNHCPRSKPASWSLTTPSPNSPPWPKASGPRSHPWRPANPWPGSWTSPTGPMGLTAALESVLNGEA